MSQTYEQLVAAFKELMERGEKDQWKLAQTAFFASAHHGGVKQFAADTGYHANTISRYKTTYEWREINDTTSYDLSFAEAFTLANMSEDKAAAVQILAGVTGKGINTVRGDKEQVAIVQNFLVENPELLKDALKDDDARSAVAAAAFKAASEGIVAEATGITTTAARKKAPKRNVSERAVQVEQLKYRASRIGHWAEGNLPSIIRDTEELAEYMTVEELDYVYNQLGQAHDIISQARTTIDNLRRAKV